VVGVTGLLVLEHAEGEVEECAHHCRRDHHSGLAGFSQAGRARNGLAP
jgi:hypothetical protein